MTVRVLVVTRSNVVARSTDPRAVSCSRLVIATARTTKMITEIGTSTVVVASLAVTTTHVVA
jgi:hypothetical protein